jgi:hypothetical protein
MVQLVRINPGRRHRAIQNQAHGRPASRSSFRSAQWNAVPSPLARARIRSFAACACWLPARSKSGTSRATTLPPRAMTISSPPCTRSSKAPSVSFASTSPTSIIAAPRTSRLTSRPSNPRRNPTQRMHYRAHSHRLHHRPPLHDLHRLIASAPRSKFVGRLETHLIQIGDQIQRT